MLNYHRCKHHVQCVYECVNMGVVSMRINWSFVVSCVCLSPHLGFVSGCLARYADELVPSTKDAGVKKFGSESEAQTWLAGSSKPRMLLFTNKGTTSTLFRMLAHMFNDRVLAAEVPQKFTAVRMPERF